MERETLGRGSQNGLTFSNVTVGEFLLEDAVVELFATPIGGGLDKSEDYRMGRFFGGRELGLEKSGDEEAVSGRFDGADFAMTAAGDYGESGFHGGPFVFGIDFEVAEEFFGDDFFVFAVERLQVGAGAEADFGN